MNAEAAAACWAAIAKAIWEAAAEFTEAMEAAEAEDEATWPAMATWLAAVNKEKKLLIFNLDLETFRRFFHLC